jgi:hypothetical protein
VTSADLAALIEETETEIAKADKEYAAGPSLDPGGGAPGVGGNLGRKFAYGYCCRRN